MATATYTPIATQTLGSVAASITFSSIPGTYTDLRLVLTGTTSLGDGIEIQFNGDTATNYSFVSLSGNGTTASSGNSSSQTSIRINTQAITGVTYADFNAFDVFSYAGSTNKTLLATAVSDQNGSGGLDLTVGLWRSTAAITSIKLLMLSASYFNTGTIATLWGI